MKEKKAQGAGQHIFIPLLREQYRVSIFPLYLLSKICDFAPEIFFRIIDWIIPPMSIFTKDMFR